MENRTIRTAIMKRIPEVYFIHHPIVNGDKIYWRMIANIKGKLYKLLADMPNTALVSHKELLNTVLNEIADEIKAIKRGQKVPEMMPLEKDWTPLSDTDKRALGINTIEDMLMDNPMQIIESNIQVENPIPANVQKLIGNPESINAGKSVPKAQKSSRIKKQKLIH